MLFFIHCVDKSDSSEIRKANREAHLEYVKDFALFTAGPTLAEDHQTMTGSVIIVELDSNDALARFLENDPYNKAGLFESVTTSPWKRVIHNSDI